MPKTLTVKPSPAPAAMPGGVTFETLKSANLAGLIDAILAGTDLTGAEADETRRLVRGGASGFATAAIDRFTTGAAVPVADVLRALEAARRAASILSRAIDLAGQLIEGNPGEVRVVLGDLTPQLKRSWS